MEDIELYPGFAWGGVAHEQGYRALISVPLRRAGAVIGALNGYRALPHEFDAAEISLVTTLATQIAIALGTAQLRAREQDTIRELRRAEEVHRLLTATALRGEGVAGVATALAELLGRPVLIEDVYAETLGAAEWGAEEHPVTTSAIDDDLAGGSIVAVNPMGTRLPASCSTAKWSPVFTCVQIAPICPGSMCELSNTPPSLPRLSCCVHAQPPRWSSGCEAPWLRIC